MIENQETITFSEFTAWFTGLIRGKAGALPDIEDWKIIKKMLEKVVVEKEKEKEYVTLPIPTPAPMTPLPYPPQPFEWSKPATPPWNDPNRPMWQPNHTYFPPGTVWASDGTGDAPPGLDTVTISDIGDGLPISGSTFKMNVDNQGNPVDANHLMSLTGAIGDMIGKQ